MVILRSRRPWKNGHSSIFGSIRNEELLRCIYRKCWDTFKIKLFKNRHPMVIFWKKFATAIILHMAIILGKKKCHIISRVLNWQILRPIRWCGHPRVACCSPQNEKVLPKCLPTDSNRRIERLILYPKGVHSGKICVKNGLIQMDSLFFKSQAVHYICFVLTVLLNLTYWTIFCNTMLASSKAIR